MDAATFSAQLRADGGYQTPPGRRVALSRLPGGPPLVMYSGFSFAVWRGNREAAKGWTLNAFQYNSIRAMRWIERAGGQFTVEGLDHLRDLDGPVVFISNHMSTLETCILPAFLLAFCDPTFVVKESLLTYPVFGRIMRAVEPIAVGRQNPREDLQAVLNQGKDRLEAGRSVVIFPQATRDVAFDVEHFNSLGVKLAKRAKAKVVPMALRTDFWSNGKRFKDFGAINPELPIHFAFDAPREVEGNGKSTHEDVVDFIRTKLTEWDVPIIEPPPKAE